MVEYFGERLEGMAFTAHGWVQVRRRVVCVCVCGEVFAVCCVCVCVGDRGWGGAVRGGGAQQAQHERAASPPR